MTTLHMAGTLLQASTDDRVLTYLLAPFDEPGRTSLGKLTLTASSLTVPDEDSVVNLPVNVEHDPTRPVGKFVRVQAKDHGIEADVRILATKAGDDVLLEVREGVRTGISYEVEGHVIRSGRLVAGQLVGAGLVVNPAYPSAQLVAADAGELPEAGDESSTGEHPSDEPADELVVNGVTYVRKQTPPEGQTDGDDAGQPAEREATVDDTLTAAAAAAAGIQPPHAGGATTITRDKLTASQVFRMVATAYKTNNQALLTAALANVTHDDGDNDGDGLGEIAAAPSWLGEVYAKASYVRKYIPLISNGALTSFKETGYNFETLPIVAKYTGNKADVPTGGMTATPVAFTVEQWAHAADLDRRFIDFGDTDVVAAFIAAQVNSYKKVTDLETAGDLLLNAAAFTPGTVPAGIDIALAAIVDGALALLAADFNPTFAIVGSDLYRSLALTKKDQVPEYLSATVDLESGSAGGFQIVPSSLPAAQGLVLVGDGATVRFKELGGGTPVRVEAEHVAQRGRDLGVFGYTSFQELVAGGVLVADLVALRSGSAGGQKAKS